MKKRWVHTLSASVAVCLAATVTFVVFAQEAGFEETFDTPELEGWEHSPDALVVNGVLSISPGNFAARMGLWDDFELDVRIRAIGEGAAMVEYRASDESRYSLLIGGGEVNLERHAVDGSTPLGGAPVGAMTQGAWMSLGLTVADGKHEVRIDGEKVLEVDDPEPLPGGAIVFIAVGEAVVEIDDLGVTVEVKPVEPGAEGPGPESEMEAAALATEEPAGDTAVSAPMSLRDLIDTLRADQSSPLAIQTFALNLALAAGYSFLLGRAYVHWGASLSNRRKFAANFMLITITTTFIILVVRSSVALSLGLVGALSIVRFRAAIKEPEELAYLFFAVGLGIGLGDNQRLLTTIALLAGLMLIGLMRLVRKSQADVNLHLTIGSQNPHKVDLDEVMRVLKAHATKLKLVRLDESGTTLESSFLVEFKKLDDLHAARKDLRALSEGIEITFLDNRGIW